MRNIVLNIFIKSVDTDETQWHAAFHEESTVFG